MLHFQLWGGCHTASVSQYYLIRLASLQSQPLLHNLVTQNPSPVLPVTSLLMIMSFSDSGPGKRAQEEHDGGMVDEEDITNMIGLVEMV